MWLLTLPNGTGPNDIIAWYDGFGPADRVKKTAFTETAIVRNTKVKGGQGITFNGTTSKVDCGSQLIGTGNVTICAWVAATGFGEGDVGCIVNNGKCILRINTTNSTFQISYDGATYKSAANNAATTTGAWQFVCATMGSTGGSTGNIYVSGVLSGAANGAVGTAANGTTNLIIGNNNAASATWGGDLTQVIIFNKILTTTQMGQMYNRMK